MTNADPATRTSPAWFDEAKFGIFIHWTVAAVPAYAAVRDFYADVAVDPALAIRELPYAEMYQNTMSIPGSSAAAYHAENYGDMPYDQFAAEFKEHLARWDPDPWADLFARAGARYVVLVTKPEDGFLLWPSAHPSPYRAEWQTERDVVGDLAAAVRARGLRFGIYYCGGVDWTFGGPPSTGGSSSLAAEPDDETFVGYVDAHWRELIERYRPAVMWNDYSFPAAGDVAALFDFYRTRVPDGVVNDRYGQRGPEVVYDFRTLEYAKDYSVAPTDQKWEACRGIGTSFGYNRLENDETYAPAGQLIHELADIVARGGNFLLNVGPTASGSIPWLQAERLLAVGWWLRNNGGAVYGTRPWQRPTGTTADGIDVRYTLSDEAVHAIVLGTPKSAEVTLDVHVEGADVTLLGRPHALRYHATSGGTTIELPEVPDEQPAIALGLSPPTAVRS